MHHRALKHLRQVDPILARIIALAGPCKMSPDHAQAPYEALVEAVLARCTEVDSGARNVDNILNGTVLPEIAETVLAKMAEGAPIARIKVSANKQGQFKYAIR